MYVSPGSFFASLPTATLLLFQGLDLGPLAVAEPRIHDRPRHGSGFGVAPAVHLVQRGERRTDHGVGVRHSLVGVVKSFAELALVIVSTDASQGCGRAAFAFSPGDALDDADR